MIVPCSSKAAYLGRYAEPDKGWTDRDEARWPVPFWHMDAAMASLLILQTAVDEGLGACFFGIPPDKVAGGARRVRHPGRLRPGRRDHPRAPGVHSGGAQGSPSRRRRKDLDEVVHRGTVGHARLTWPQSIQSGPRTPADSPRRCLGSEIGGGVCPGRGRGTPLATGGSNEGRQDMVVLGLILLIIGLVASIPILTTIGVILLVVGLILNLVPIGGTRRRVF